MTNTTNKETSKYTEEQYNADLQKWFYDTKLNEKYIKGQTNWTEKYTHEFKKWSGEIRENKIDISPRLLESNISIQKTIINSATPINMENLDITEMIKKIE